MKRLIFTILLFAGITAKAQWTPIYGKQRFMQGLAIPYTDTTALKNISDTGCIVMGRDSAIYYRYKGPWKKLGGGSETATDTTSLSNRIDLRVKYTDTASMLSPYAKSSAVALKVNIADTASMLSPYAKSSTVALKVNIADTATMLSPYAKSSAVALKVNIADTATMLNPYAKSSAVALKVNIADTATMLSPYVRRTLPASPTPYPINTNGNYLIIGSYSSPFTSGRIDIDNTIAAIGTQTGGAFAGLKFTQTDGSAVFSNSGTIRMVPLSGTGTRMVVAGSAGELSTQTIPSGGSGTVTNVATGYGLSGGPITNTGTIIVDSATLSTKYLRIVDTANKWVNSVSQPNDSTIRVIKNGATNDLIIRSSVAGSATRLITQVYNNSGATIAKGSVIYINGAHSSNLPTIALAKANTEATSAYTYGLVETDIANNSSGTVIQNGSITNLNLPTSNYTDGQTLYLSPTVAGGYTTTKPLAPYHYVAIGTVTRAHPNFGTIQIAVRNGFQLDEMSDVSIAITPADSTLLQFSRVDSLWHDVSVVNAIGTKYIKPSDTSVFQRKSISAYSIMANNTNAAANATAQTFRDTAGTYSGTITWIGTTAPTTPTISYYQWQQTGKWVHLQIFIQFSIAGAAITAATLTIPGDCPAPDISMFQLGNTAVLYSGIGGLGLSSTTVSLTTTCYMRRNATNTANELYVAGSSNNYRRIQYDITYRAQ